MIKIFFHIFLAQISLLVCHCVTSRVQDLHHGAQLPATARSSSAVLGRPLLPVSHVASRQHSQVRQSTTPGSSASLVATYGRRAFSVAGPSAWKSLPDNLRDPSVARL